MKFVPTTDRPAWRDKALELADSADLPTQLGLFLEAEALDWLKDRVRRSSDGDLEGVSHSLTEPSAAALEEICPDLAARLWRAQGMRILNSKNSRYYDAALLNFESAKRCFESAGLARDWDATVEDVRARHGRKRGFMPDFDALVAGSGPSDRPSFLERAKAGWGDTESET